MKHSFPARAPKFKTLLLLPRWPCAARVVSQRRINSSTTTTKPKAENKLFSRSFPPSMFHTFTSMDTKNSNTHTHTFVPLVQYVHDITLASKIYEHQACCHANFEHSPFFSELLWMFWEIITHEQNYTETGAAKLTAKMFMDRGSG